MKTTQIKDGSLDYIKSEASGLLPAMQAIPGPALYLLSRGVCTIPKGIYQGRSSIGLPKEYPVLAVPCFGFGWGGVYYLPMQEDFLTPADLPFSGVYHRFLRPEGLNFIKVDGNEGDLIVGLDLVELLLYPVNGLKLLLPSPGDLLDLPPEECTLVANSLDELDYYQFGYCARQQGIPLTLEFPPTGHTWRDHVELENKRALEL